MQIGDNAANAAHGGSQSAVRAENARRLLKCLAECGQLTQAELSRESGLSTSTVSSVVASLARAGLVARDQTSSGRNGRKVGLSANAGLVAGIEVGKRHLRVAICRRDHEILAEERQPIAVRHDYADTIQLISQMIDRLVAKLGTSRSAILAAGMALPDSIDSRTHKLVNRGFLPGWLGIDIAAQSSQILGMTVFPENNVNLAALGEYRHGLGRGVPDMVYLKLDEGIGAGIITGGRLLQGATGSASEFGHLTITPSETVCRCGNRGCLDTLASGEKILSLLAPIHGAQATITEVVEAARDGDAAAARVFSDAGRTVGIALANVCNLLNPSLVVVGGKLAGVGDILLTPMREVVHSNALPSATCDLQIVPSQLGDRAELIGALSLGLREAPLPLDSEASFSD